MILLKKEKTDARWWSTLSPSVRLLFFLAIMPAHCAKADTLDTFSVEKDGVTLDFNGMISLSSSHKLKLYLDNGIKTIIINSPGGDGVAGLSIAEEFRKKKTNLVVDKYCLSSCANYLFVAAERKTLRPGAILGLHGGLTGAPIPVYTLSIMPLATKDELTEFNSNLQILYEKENGFFKSIGFDPRLFKLSDSLTSQNHTRYIDVTSRGEMMGRFSLDDTEKARALLARLLTERGESSWTMSLDSDSLHKVYFPDEATLLAYGVKGIESYAYPANVAAMNKLVGDLHDDVPGFPLLNVVGDLAGRRDAPQP